MMTNNYCHGIPQEQLTSYASESEDRQKFNIATTIKSETLSSVAHYSEVLCKVAGWWRQGPER